MVRMQGCVKHTKITSVRKNDTYRPFIWVCFGIIELLVILKTRYGVLSKFGFKFRKTKSTGGPRLIEFKLLIQRFFFNVSFNIQIPFKR